jgi:Putative metal-binding motif
MFIVCRCCLTVIRTTATCAQCGQAPDAPIGRAAAVATLLGLSLAVGGCGDKDSSDTSVVALYGAPATDSADAGDLDGDSFTTDDGDCDDSDPSIYPGAEEIPGDGIDSNCDESDDT